MISPMKLLVNDRLSLYKRRHVNMFSSNFLNEFESDLSRSTWSNRVGIDFMKTKLITIDSEGRFHLREGILFRGEVLQRGCNEENQ